ncbi:MAG TPA: LysR family transcriptional regulator substrate-binding protein [Actinospica sp.]|jgi:DNA-binding transcriptional LysR family regulator|nr:LysR family transcriptional regulator substrate-binding protein [Actinospica sp.]
MPITKDAIRIMTGAATLRHFMSDAVVEYRFRNPRVHMEFLTASSSGECLDALRKGDADLAWITVSGAADDVEQRPVVELPWMLAMRSGDYYADRAWVEVPELSGLRVIRPPENSTSGRVLTAALTDVTLGDAAGATDWDTALLLAGLGVGHAIVPRFPDQQYLADGAVHLVPLRGLPPLPVGWAARSWDALSPAARSFAEVATRSLRYQCDLNPP